MNYSMKILNYKIYFIIADEMSSEKKKIIR